MRLLNDLRSSASVLATSLEAGPGRPEDHAPSHSHIASSVGSRRCPRGYCAIRSREETRWSPGIARSSRRSLYVSGLLVQSASGRAPPRRSPRAPLRRAGVERRLGVVLDAQLDRLRHLARRRSSPTSVKRHVDPRRHPGGGGELAVEHDALGDDLYAEPAQLLERLPVGWSRACRRAAPRPPRISEPVQTEVVHVEVSCAARSHSCTGPSSHQRHLAGTAGDEHDVRMGELRERGVGEQRRAGRCRCAMRSGPLGHERDAPRRAGG